MMIAIAFSRQNDAGSCARTTLVLKNLILVVILILESKGRYYNYRVTEHPHLDYSRLFSYG